MAAQLLKSAAGTAAGAGAKVPVVAGRAARRGSSVPYRLGKLVGAATGAVWGAKAIRRLGAGPSPDGRIVAAAGLGGVVAGFVAGRIAGRRGGGTSGGSSSSSSSSSDSSSSSSSSGSGTSSTSTATGPGALNDAALAEKVRSEIFRPDDAPKGDVNVNVEHGAVYLRGQVDDQGAVDELVTRARGVDGVTRVVNLIHGSDEPAPSKDDA